MVEHLSRYYVCAWKKLGTFTVVKQGGRVVRKEGGNVAAYMCLPDGVVLGAVLGNTDADSFLEEARWAGELASRLKGRDDAERGRVIAQAHGLRAEALLAKRRGADIFT